MQRRGDDVLDVEAARWDRRRFFFFAREPGCDRFQWRVSGEAWAQVDIRDSGLGTGCFGDGSRRTGPSSESAAPVVLYRVHPSTCQI